MSPCPSVSGVRLDACHRGLQNRDVNLFDGSDMGVLPFFAQGTTFISAADTPHICCVFHSVFMGKPRFSCGPAACRFLPLYYVTDKPPVSAAEN